MRRNAVREPGPASIASDHGAGGTTEMLTSSIVRVVAACCRLAWAVLLASAAVTAASGYYAATHFAINTDSSQLISPDLPWRQRELAFDAAFPQRSDLIVVVIDGLTPELAEDAARQLTRQLAKRGDLFRVVRRPDGGPFLERNGLLFLPADEVERMAEQLIRAQPFLGTLAADPTLRGFAGALSLIPQGVEAGQGSVTDFQRPMTLVADAIDGVLYNELKPYSWAQVMTGQAPALRDLRRFIHVKPLLDFTALEPGKRASDAIREAATELGLIKERGVLVRLTGPVAMADEEFSTVADGFEINTAATVLAVLVIIWLALKSGRLILAVFLSLVAGLVMTAAAGLAMVGSLNLISVAFAVLFVGIGVDFGIQYSVRYRAERHRDDRLVPAIVAAAHEAGKPLALAAAATAAGFFAFLPTDYRGVSELGLIAGVGMTIAFVTSITLLPALLAVLKPKAEAAEVGYRWLAPVDRFLARYRIPVLAATALVVAAGLPLLGKVRFDFNPLNLRSVKVESVRTLLDLMQDPATSPNTIDILAPSREAARVLAAKLGRLPEVSRALTVDSFVPDDQEKKLAIIRDAQALLGPTLSPQDTKPRPSDAETVAALLAASEAYAAISHSGDGTSIEALHLSSVLRQLAEAAPAKRQAAEATLIPGLTTTLEQIRTSLNADTVTFEGLPKDITRDWMTDDGRVRIELAPSGDGNDNEVLRRFASAVLAVAPQATGTPVLIQESAKTVVSAFMQAGIWALVSITLILAVVLRRLSDIAMTLVPLLLAGVVTLELTVLLDLPLNFANIIALPLLLGVGVAFKIYYVLAWRAGETSLLASSLTRAVFFSAMTTATAFGSLWLSNHPGTSSMGELLSLSLVTTLAAAVLFQPILMGPPRQPKGEPQG